MIIRYEGQESMAQVFTLDEKRTFIETLLVITGIMTAFDASAFKTLIFVTFAVGCLGFIIWISIQKNRVGNRPFTRHHLLANWILAAFISILFSALVLLVGLTSSLANVKSVSDVFTAIGIWSILYFMLWILLTYVLGKE